MLKIHRLFIIIGIVFIVLIAITVYANKNNMQKQLNAFVKDYTQQLKAEGISQQTITDYASNVKVSLALYNFNQKKPINVSNLNTIPTYYNDTNVLLAQNYFKENTNILASKSVQYKVAEEAVVSGIIASSKAGEDMGADLTINILTTQYLLDNTNINYINELTSFLKLVDKGFVSIDASGYIDGTISQLGITPTVYLLDATDGDNDGIVDLYHNKQDIIETAFALLAKNDYKEAEPIANQVEIPTTLEANALFGIQNAKNTNDWRKAGITRLNNKNYVANLYADLTPLNNNLGALRFHNYNVVVKTNNNPIKSTAIGLLAEDVELYLNLINYKRKNVLPKAKPTYKKRASATADDNLTVIYGTK